ncbi:hypothetical protein M0R19_05810 [Candidatus Pacearchaeota archaeon]|jgi:hypothetical protein|nr:hypothetical protein [Candidatus Pacearchaeota archaeon]
MKLSIIKETSEYRGDHSRDLLVAYDYIENESIEDLCKRVFEIKVDDKKNHYFETITIRLVKENTGRSQIK